MLNTGAEGAVPFLEAPNTDANLGACRSDLDQVDLYLSLARRTERLGSAELVVNQVLLTL